MRMLEDQGCPDETLVLLGRGGSGQAEAEAVSALNAGASFAAGTFASGAGVKNQNTAASTPLAKRYTPTITTRASITSFLFD